MNHHWTYDLDINHHWTYITWTISQLDMDYFGLIPLLGIRHLTNHSNGHHSIYIIMIFKSSFNRSYSTKKIIHLFQPLSRFLEFGFYLFVGLKMHRKPLVYAAQSQVPDWTSQNKFGFSKATPPVEDTWLRVKTTLDNV